MAKVFKMNSDKSKNYTIKTQDGKHAGTGESEPDFQSMLLELTHPFILEENYTAQFRNIIQLAMMAWNLSIIKKLFPDFYGDFRKGHEKSNGHLLPDDWQKVERMMEEKERKFPETEEMIDRIEAGENDNHEVQVTVYHLSVEEYIARETLALEQNELNFEPGYIDRRVIILKHKEPFFNWLNENYNGDEPVFYTQSRVYLTGFGNTEKEEKRWLDVHFAGIFENELEEWITDEAVWPKNRTLALFKSWFSCEIADFAFDLEGFPVDKY